MFAHPMPPPSHQASLMLITLAAIIGLVIAIGRYRLNAFVALVLASLFVGLAAGMPLANVTKAFQEGVGAMLGAVAVVVGLGIILGKMLSESGGAEVVAAKFIEWMGEKRLPWTLFWVAFIVGIPVFFTVGMVLLVPILMAVARKSKLPLLSLAIPMIAALSAAHGLVPPHPGPMAAIGMLKADAGKTILWSLVVGLPAAMIAGPILGKILSARVLVEMKDTPESARVQTGAQIRPGFGATLMTILFPVGLMLVATLADMALAKESSLRPEFAFLGHPVVSLLAAVLISFYTFGAKCGFSRAQIASFAEASLGPAAPILLVVGAGGGFNKVLVASGVGEAVASAVAQSNLSPLLLGWLIAALIRIATGSATVAISTAAGIMAPIALKNPAINPELLVISMGSGSLILSHLNDGGFWFVKEYLNLTVAETLKTWTVVATVLGVCGLGFVLLAAALIR